MWHLFFLPLKLGGTCDGLGENTAEGTMSIAKTGCKEQYTPLKLSEDTATPMQGSQATEETNGSNHRFCDSQVQRGPDQEMTAIEIWFVTLAVSREGGTPCHKARWRGTRLFRRQTREKGKL